MRRADSENRRMQPILPFWFKQRQCKAEPAGSENVLKVSAPNLGEAFIRVEQADNQQWRAALRLNADGPDVQTTGADFVSPQAAWDVAFELFRQNVIV
jgi:hypothetical protein